MNNRKEYMKKWQENNRDKTRESARRWYNKNIEKIKDKRKTNEYKEKHREYNKKYKQKKQQELERYKNIIDELEKYLKEKEQHFLIDDCQKEIIYEYKRISAEYTKALDKLKELKGE